MTDLVPYADRDHLISSIKKVRNVLVSLVTEEPYDTSKGYSLSHISDIHRDLVQSLCMMDDTDRRNASFGAEVDSLTQMKQEFLGKITEALETETGTAPGKAEYVEEIVTPDE